MINNNQQAPNNLQFRTIITNAYFIKTLMAKPARRYLLLFEIEVIITNCYIPSNARTFAHKNSHNKLNSTFVDNIPIFKMSALCAQAEIL